MVLRSLYRQREPADFARNRDCRFAEQPVSEVRAKPQNTGACATLYPQAVVNMCGTA